MAVLVSHFPAKWGPLLDVSPPRTPCFLTCVSDRAPLSLLSNTESCSESVSSRYRGSHLSSSSLSPHEPASPSSTSRPLPLLSSPMSREGQNATQALINVNE